MKVREAGRKAWAVASLVLAVLAWATVVPAGASPGAHTANPESCPGVATDVRLGTAAPVLMVPGFNESPAVFSGEGSPTLSSAVSSAFPGTVKVMTFDYSKWSRLWVTFTLIGPKLARCITWLAHTSAAQHGPGQVIIVAHSMGGLAVRCAVDPSCAPGGQAADPNLIGLVITLGTPNTGSNPQTLGPVFDTVCALFSWCDDLLVQRDSPAAQAMVSGSPDLTKLPLLPVSIPVDAIAGRITVTTNLFGQQYVLKDFGDIAVPVDSALADARQGTLHAGPGAGKVTVPCGSVSVTQVPGWLSKSTGNLAPAPPVTCWHLTETIDPVWQSDILAAIKAALQGLCTPAAISAALAVKDPANAPQRTLVADACAGGWAVAEIHQPLTLSDGSTVQDTGYAILKHTDTGWSSQGLGDGTCLAAPGNCPGVLLPPPAVLRTLLQGAGINLTATSAELYINTAFTAGALYKYPTGPTKIGIDNQNYIDGLQWQAGNQGDLVGTGTLHYNNCSPSCASGAYETYAVQITASEPHQCSVDIYPNGLGSPAQTVNAEVFNRIDVQALQGTPPSSLVGTAVLPGPCK